MIRKVKNKEIKITEASVQDEHASTVRSRTHTNK